MITWVESFVSGLEALSVTAGLLHGQPSKGRNPCSNCIASEREGENGKEIK